MYKTYNVKKTAEYFLSGIFAGVLIGISASVYLVCPAIAGSDIVREVLFSFGLLTIFHLKYNLYTGKAGFIFKEEFTGFKGTAALFSILIANFAGIIIWSFIIGFTKYSQIIIAGAQSICEARTGMPSLNLFMSAIGCGIMMNIAARTKEKSVLTVLCVVIFLTLGFSHCIADFFYYTVTGFKIAYIRTVFISVFGNLVGGNLLRFWFLDNSKSLDNSENLGKNNHEDN